MTITAPVAREFVRRLYRVLPDDPMAQLDLLADETAQAFNGGKALVSFSHQASSSTWQLLHSYSPMALMELLDVVREAYDRAADLHNTATPTKAQVLSQMYDAPAATRSDFSSWRG